MGGGIRTEAGTGVELDKKKEADGAAEGKILAGGAAAEQANCIWLISRETMTLNFLKKSMPRMGSATAACRKVYVKILPSNCTIFWKKPQEGMGWLSAPLGRGPDGLELWLQGTMLKVAPVSIKSLSLVNSSVRNIKPAFAG